MPPDACEQYLQQLVDFADGELPAAEAARVAEHLAACPACRQQLLGLRQSLAAARGIWQAAADELVNTGQRPQRPARRWWPRAGIGVAAALLLLILGHFATRPRHEPAPAADHVAGQIADAGLAEQMLVVGRMLAETPGGRPYAVERFRYITDHYPASGAAQEARARLAELTKKG